MSIMFLILWLVHTTKRQDKTRLSCLVLSVFAVWTELETSQDCLRLKISKQFCPVSKCGVNWVLSCSQMRSHRWQDNTVLSCPCSRCELAIRVVAIIFYRDSIVLLQIHYFWDSSPDMIPYKLFHSRTAATCGPMPRIFEIVWYAWCPTAVSLCIALIDLCFSTSVGCVACDSVLYIYYLIYRNLLITTNCYRPQQFTAQAW